MNVQYSDEIPEDAGYEWIVAFFATVIAGGIFGVLYDFLGIIAGPLIAFGIGIFVIPSVAALTWALLLSRFANIAAAFAGAATGVLSVLLNRQLLNFVFRDVESSLIVAGCIGAIVPGVATTYYMHRRRQRHKRHGIPETPAFKFSLQSLFLRMTVVAIIVAMWSGMVTYYLRW
jgi:hypothetical protein